jgi:hypothetical protein
MSKMSIQDLRRLTSPDGGKAHDEAFRFLRASDELNPEQAPKGGPLLDRALGILHRMATEQTGWRAIFRRWYYSDEPLRNDAANLVRQAGFQMAQPDNTRLVGDNQ